MSRFLMILLALALAPQALAETKVYTAESPQSGGGTRFVFASTLCPTIAPTPGALRGSTVLDDTGAGTVTMTEFILLQPALIDIDTTLAFGPGSFIFLDGDNTSEPTQGQTGLGSTDKGSTVDWGIIGGWDVTGATFCISSPTATCDNAGFMHGVTAVPVQPSATYDLGTWTFDATGNYGGSDYIQRTTMGGMGNVQWRLQSTLVGGAVPALPLLGIGALGLGLLTIGTRSMLRKK